MSKDSRSIAEILGWIRKKKSTDEIEEFELDIEDEGQHIKIIRKRNKFTVKMKSGLFNTHVRDVIMEAWKAMLGR